MASADTIYRAALDALNGQNIRDAEHLIRELLRQQSKHLGALNLISVVLMLTGRFAEAEPYLISALSQKSDDDMCLSNYAYVLKELNRHDEALAAFTQAISINPSNALTWNNRGTVLHDLGRYQAAISDFKTAEALEPRFAEAICATGNALGCLRRYDEANAAFERALSLNQNLVEAWQGRGTVLGIGSRYEESFAAYDKAWQLAPDLVEVEGLRLHVKMHLCNWRDFESEEAHFLDAVRQKPFNGSPSASPKLGSSPFFLIALKSSAADQYAYARGCTTSKRVGRLVSRPTAPSSSKIRIGYVSSDFNSHPTSHLLVGVIENHDRSRFEVFGISIGNADDSEIGTRITAAFDHFIDANTLDDDELAARIRDAGIDVLVDLNGHTKNARIDLFVRRPVNVQVNYLGYPGTMGADCFDYIIADPILIPSSEQSYYSEKIAYLPHTYQPNDDKRPHSGRTFSRSECGLPERGLVFCCFNNAFKITPGIFDRWMRLLERAESSVLWLLDSNAAAVANLKKEALARGIDENRLIFAERMVPAEHLARLQLADLFLDTLPYNAHTTASDALWAGVPVLTQIGETFAGRVAASLLNAIGMPELVAETPEAYENLAVELARSPEKLAVIKKKLARHRLTAPLFDTQLYTRHLESAYLAMCERYRGGLPTDHLYVPA